MLDLEKILPEKNAFFLPKIVLMKTFGLCIEQKVLKAKQVCHRESK